MNKPISAQDIRTLRDKLRDSHNLPTLTATRLEEDLRKIADGVKYRGKAICYEDRAESDEIRDILRTFESESFAAYMYGD